MAVKGFYFSFDALMALMIMALASSVLVISASANTVTSDDIRFSQYSSQANDIANTMQVQEAGDADLNLSLEPSEKGLTVSSLIVERYENGEDAEEIAEAYLEDYRYGTEIYLDDGGGLEEVYSDSSFSNSASATFLTGPNQYTVVVVVGE